VGDGDEHPRHEVDLNAFYIDKYPVTNDQYGRFCEATHRAKPAILQPATVEKLAGKSSSGREPVVFVSWNDAAAYAKWAGKRLPTEAEWEKAARGGTDTKWFFGDDDSVKAEYGWYEPMKNFGDGAFPDFKVVSYPVGMKKPNPYGLFDTSGLVFEWCSDWYNSKYYKVSPGQNPQGPDKGNEKVLRGGSGGTSDMRSAARYLRKGPDSTDPLIGFRCVKDAVVKAK
jgi:formylglycine-generating enzyme required for sulfatase activity